MADGEVMLASAVVIPDAPEINNDSHLHDPPTLKRRQTDTSEPDTSKRARLSVDGRVPEQRNGSIGDQRRTSIPGEPAAHHSPTLDNAEDGPRTARRQTGREEERKRGKRMFGALLGALAGSAPRSGSGVQKRRADIEKRAQEKLKQIDEDGKQKQREHHEKMSIRKRREQWTYDEQVMKTRHDNKLATARFLCTTSNPPLYYKPWELRPSEQEQIARQIAEAEDQIDRELDEFDSRRRDALQELDRLDQLEVADDPVPNGNSKSTLENAEPISQEVEQPHLIEVEQQVEDTNTAPLKDHDTAPSNPQTESKQEGVHESPLEVLDEHDGETMFKTDEDTVIY